ncbi:hypothetical protein DsansV1_C31g0218011 [Dioscorea sansibarensis]
MFSPLPTTSEFETREERWWILVWAGFQEGDRRLQMKEGFKEHKLFLARRHRSPEEETSCGMKHIACCILA